MTLKKFTIRWKFTESGESYVEATTPEEAKRLAEEMLDSDYDSLDFTQKYEIEDVTPDEE